MTHRYLLVLRFALYNIVATGLLIAIYLQGWLDGLFVKITQEISLGIFAVFIYGLVNCGFKVWRTSVELNDTATGDAPPESRAGQYLAGLASPDAQSRSNGAAALRLKLTNRIVIVRQTANTLVFLGLIGTVIGFIIALSGVDPKAATEVENVAPMVSRLIQGMSLALYTTLVGSVLYIWLIVNHRILASGTVHLINAVINHGEARART